MAVILEAALQPDGPALLQLADPTVVEKIARSREGEIREWYFLAAVKFQVGDLDLSRTRVPVIDFALTLRSALDELLVKGASELSFQDGPDRIRFSLEGDRVEVRANYISGRGTCSYGEIYRAVLTSTSEILDLLTAVGPGLLKNSFLEFLYRFYGVRDMGEDQFLRHSRVMAELYG